MTRTIVCDSGALIAIERNDRRMIALVRAARDSNATILIPSAVVAEVWRDGRAQAQVARFFKSVDAFPPLDFEAAKSTGELIAGIGGAASVVDAAVASIARRWIPALLVTSDPDDISALIRDVPPKSVELFIV